MKQIVLIKITILICLFACRNEKQVDIAIGEYVTVPVIDSIKGKSFLK